MFTTIIDAGLWTTNLSDNKLHVNVITVAFDYALMTE